MQSPSRSLSYKRARDDARNVCLPSQTAPGAEQIQAERQNVPNSVARNVGCTSLGKVSQLLAIRKCPKNSLVEAFCKDYGITTHPSHLRRWHAEILPLNLHQVAEDLQMVDFQRTCGVTQPAGLAAPATRSQKFLPWFIST